MRIVQKTFSASTIKALDIVVNDFIGRKTLDGRSVDRTVLFQTFMLSGGIFYLSVLYQEDQIT